MREVSRDTKRFLSGHGTGMFAETDDETYIVGGMLNRAPLPHTKLRRIVAKIFPPRMLQEVEGSLDLNAYGEGLAGQRRKMPGDDLISVLVAAGLDDDKLSDFDIGIYFQLLITAGIETTASSIAQGITFLTTHLDQWHDWRENYGGLVVILFN